MLNIYIYIQRSYAIIYVYIYHIYLYTINIIHMCIDVVYGLLVILVGNKSSTWIHGKSTVVVRFYTGVRCFKSQALRFIIVKKKHKNPTFPKDVKNTNKIPMFPKDVPNVI